MRVGILTFHTALNYGAVLQAYALQHSIGRLGHDCEVIDYHCDSLEASYGVMPTQRISPSGIASAVAHAPGRLLRRSRFRQFREQNLRISPQSYDSTNIREACFHYDRIVVGSDQVWNPDLTGGDGTYFLDFCGDAAKKVSYAASLGRSRMMVNHADLYLRCLPTFSSLSVREQDSRDYLSALLGREVFWVVDPVLLLSSEEWNDLVTHPRQDVPYIFAYCLHEKSLYRYVESLRRSTGREVVYVTESLRTRTQGRRIPQPTVGEFLGLIRHADYVVTDSFHVLALAIVFRREFRAQLKGELAELNSRVTSLLSAAGLEKRALLPDENPSSKMLPAIDYEGVFDRLGPLVGDSIGYLRRALASSPPVDV